MNTAARAYRDTTQSIIDDAARIRAVRIELQRMLNMPKIRVEAYIPAKGKRLTLGVVRSADAAIALAHRRIGSDDAQDISYAVLEPR